MDSEVAVSRWLGPQRQQRHGDEVRAVQSHSPPSRWQGPVPDGALEWDWECCRSSVVVIVVDLFRGQNGFTQTCLCNPKSFCKVCAFGGTERAFSGIHDHKEFNGSGVYRCACCGAPLFPLDAKFNSGTGWPSFTAPVTDAMGYRKDILQYGSTEVHCSTCGAHLGHVFDDGPPPTGLRYCINSACLWYDEFASAIVAASSPWILNAYLVLLLLTGCCASCCVFSKHAVVVAQPYLQKPKADRVDVEATPVPRANAFADA